MHNTIQIECPPELLLGLHVNAEQFGERIKREAALALFREGTLSSGMAAQWLGVPRVHFLLDALRAGATLLEDSEDDFRREAAL